MVKLYREQISRVADALEAEFRDMVLGYNREVIDPAEAKRQFGANHTLPVITDTKKIVGGDEIPSYIEELKKLVRDWQHFQGDYCYVDYDGEVC